VKKLNRLRYRFPSPAQAREVVTRCIAATHGSRLGGLACRIEGRLVRAGFSFRIGIRELTVLERP